MEQAYPLNSSPQFSNPISIPFRSAQLLRSGGFALGVTGLLLLGMTQLIATDYQAPVDDPLPKVLSIHMPEVKPTVYKSEPALKQQELPPPMQRVEVQHKVDPGEIPLTLDPPVVDRSTIGPAVVSADPLPIYKPAPQYPRRALARGIEGYVVVEFTITKNGSVRDPFVVGGYDSAGLPTDVFNSAALNAVERFKYRPPMSEGQPVEQHGVRNRISFKLAQ
ncbi:energy transducer TonB [Microbulbifer pacificus]|uniref:Protein TonB n=1 Tax=Microbulbifer pacificus TaxID=407164 RepID=A0AAU0MX71_9GAMM|nr:TonB family protein [Microbulbifer pacificus]WOX04466.1 TonB family protein [Microbulbifer pacificus]